jgi:hypothetical protein
MNPTGKTLLRCRELADEAAAISRKWADSFSDDYEGKIRFAMAVAHSVLALSGVTPMLDRTSDEFIEAVKEGVVLWVELGEPTRSPEEEE